MKTMQLCLFCLLFVAGYSHAQTPLQTVRQGEEAFSQGAYAKAINNWQQALPQLESNAQVDLHIRIGSAYQALGDYRTAYQYLLQHQKSATQQQQILIHSQLADTLLGMQQTLAAAEQFEQGVKLARQTQQPQMLAHILNHQGTFFSVQDKTKQAEETYEQAYQQAEQAQDADLQINIRSNQARLALQQQNITQSLQHLQQAQALLPKINFALAQQLALAQLALRIHRESQHPQALAFAENRLQLAAQNPATAKETPRLQAQVRGYLGQVYERKGEIAHAQKFSRMALFLSQKQPDLSYQWHWQLGRLHRAEGDIPAAIQAYQQALDILHPIRMRLTSGRRDVQEFFLQSLRPVYFGLADLLLQQAWQASAEAKEQLLKQARATVEKLKVAELEEYFQDECVAISNLEKVPVVNLDALTRHTAMLYPILLPDRMELLVSLADGIHHLRVPVSEREMTQTIRAFQYNLQDSRNNRFIREAIQLHEWLIQPLLPLLSKYQIDTLVIVPDGALRMIPLGTLYDRETRRFLIQDYALAVTPSLDLTDPRPLPHENISVLLNGLSKGVQNFTALPNVPREIRGIESLFQQRQTLLDEKFSLTSINQALENQPYSIVHIASHGQFDTDPRNTFLLTYHDKLTMNKLETLLGLGSIRKQPVELLTLSACQTAVGDERAALGLAGVAIRAGARSALASLWFVNDEATSKLIVEFYRQLQQPNTSKAQALRKAQLALLKQRMFRHPAFWGAFLLIGNWL
ncbi:CHAT domain-containing protein [Candidatus Venteria ishoeyi]|uniref:Photosystem I assembly protein Ycf3 n=1 Tax=Candidatus Venteria ishoeyi TaxID=1899563 RepID=A0A1H6FD98_9GAMM|nr:CHAT domain-containing protein [Candidatus Venteria ishoeyi]SEH07371.1 photosystem I assembly protein Ycf3 [Candidatus Venteria ishoeyi]